MDGWLMNSTNIPGAQAAYPPREIYFPIDDKGIYFAAQLPAKSTHSVVASNEGAVTESLSSRSEVPRAAPRPFLDEGLLRQEGAIFKRVGASATTRVWRRWAILEGRMEFRSTWRGGAVPRFFIPLAERLGCTG